MRNHRVRIRIGHDVRLLDRLLYVHPKLRDVEEELQLGLPLRIAPRRSENHQRLAVLHHENRIECLPWTLARRDFVRMSLVDMKTSHHIIDEEPGSVDIHSATEVTGKRRCNRHHVAILVDHTDVRR